MFSLFLIQIALTKMVDVSKYASQAKALIGVNAMKDTLNHPQTSQNVQVKIIELCIICPFLPSFHELCRNCNNIDGGYS